MSGFDFVNKWLQIDLSPTAARRLFYCLGGDFLAGTCTRFRLIRLRCHIALRDLAEAAEVSPQRVSVCELGEHKLADPEKLVSAFETVLARRKAELDEAERICRYERGTLFDFVKEDCP